MRTALYARVSTDIQNVKQQLDYLKKWAEREKHEIVCAVADEESGRTPLVQRKRFCALLEKAKRGEIDILVVQSLDRLTRNWDDSVMIEGVFRSIWDSCKLVSLTEPVDLGSAQGRMMFRVNMALACFMPEQLRERQRIGIERAKAEGKMKGGKKGRKWNR